jgi:hypothetical protein
VVEYNAPASTVTFGTGASMRLTVRRLGSDAADTYVGSVYLLGVIVEFAQTR